MNAIALEGWAAASEATQDAFNRWGHKPFRAVLEKRLGDGVETVFFDLTILQSATTGRFIPAHGGVMREEKETPAEAAQDLDAYYAQLPDYDRMTSDAWRQKWAITDPWAVVPNEYLGRVDRVDPLAACWDEEGFLGSRPQFVVDDKAVIHESSPITYGYIDGAINDTGTTTRHQYRIGRGIGKDEGRYFLVACAVHSDGRMRDEGAVGEYAGTGNGIMASHRGKGVGRAFFKALMERKIWRPEMMGYSPGGLAVVRSAHREIVAAAIFEGKDVPPAVLAAYPERTGDTVSELNEELAKALEALVPHVLHYATLPKAHSEAHKDVANARAKQRATNAELLTALEILVPHVLHYATLPKAHSDAHKDVANARAAIARAANPSVEVARSPRPQG